MICLSTYGTFYVWTGETEDERGATPVLRDRDDKTYNIKEDVERYKRFNQTFNSLLRHQQDNLVKHKHDVLMNGAQINPKDSGNFSLSNGDKLRLWKEAFMRLCPQAKQVPPMNWMSNTKKR